MLEEHEFAHFSVQIFIRITKETSKNYLSISNPLLDQIKSMSLGRAQALVFLKAPQIF